MPSIAVIRKIEIRGWGSEVALTCLDDPLSRRGLDIVFRECCDIQWTVLDSSATIDLEADVIGFVEGERDYRQPAVLTTDVFEVSVRYERMDVVWSEPQLRG